MIGKFNDISIKDNFLSLLTDVAYPAFVNKYIDAGHVVSRGRKLTIIYISDSKELLDEYLKGDFSKTKDAQNYDLTQLTK